MLRGHRPPEVFDSGCAKEVAATDSGLTFGAVWGCSGLSGAVWGCSELSGAVSGCSELFGVVLYCLGLWVVSDYVGLF